MTDTAGYLVTEKLVKRFDEAVAVDEVSLSIGKGEIFALLGSSGCGKSTLLRMLAGFEKPTSGRILLGGQDVAKMPPYDRPVNMMFQSYALFPHLNIWENVAFGLKREGLPKAEVEQRTNEMLALVQLTPYAKRKPHQLSGGQQQRVALARSLAKKPKLLLLDEPLGALDKKLREQTQFELVNIIEKVGVTVVMVTHDQEEAMTMASRIAIMSKGRVLQVGTPKEIYDTPANVYVATFMGSPAMNVVPARVVVQDGVPHAAVKAHDGAEQLLRFSQANLAAWDGREILLGLRPESITDPEGADRNSGTIVNLTNRITVTEPAGADTFVTMELGGKDIVARMRADVNIGAGDQYTFAVNMEKAVAFDPKTEDRITP